jgi:hypothetical protein
MRKSIRLAGPALAAAVALLAAGCSSDSGSGDGDGDDKKKEQPDGEQTDSTDPDDADPDGDAEPGTLDGAYVGVWGSSEGDALLRLGSDRVATLILETEACLGGASEAAGQTVIALQCAESTEYGAGRAEVSGEVLTIDWDGGGEKQYDRLADVDVDLNDLNLGELGLEELENFDPSQLDLDGIDLSEIEDLLPPGESIDIGGD